MLAPAGRTGSQFTYSSNRAIIIFQSQQKLQMGACAEQSIAKRREKKEYRIVRLPNGVSKITDGPEPKKVDQHQQLKKLIYKYFEQFDLDGDGQLSQTQLGHVLTALAKHLRTTSAIDIKANTRQMMETMDKNKDGLITKVEFYQFYVRVRQ